MEDQNEKDSKTLANLLYPELMSQDELIVVLKQVCLFVLQSCLYFYQRMHRYLQYLPPHPDQSSNGNDNDEGVIVV